MDETISSDTPEISPELRAQLARQVAGWHGEARKFLTALPKDLEFIFDNRYLISQTGTGGFTLSKKKVALSFDPNFRGDMNAQLQDLRATVFHEDYHVVQGFTGEDYTDNLPALDDAIYEGAATVFERDRAGAKPLWGEYPDDETMKKWLEEVRSLPVRYDWQKYKFYDPETDRRWIMYQTGTYIVDKALKANPKLKIEDLATSSPSDILAQAGLDPDEALVPSWNPKKMLD